MQNNQPLVSVIVPVYKVEAYLDDCVESIVEQTYTNLEIILVDDGSPDKCPEMCDDWAKKDVRIKVIHKQNGGLSDARNAGLDIATGDYIAFVDSDDLIDTRMICILVRDAICYAADIVDCNFKKFDNKLPNEVELEKCERIAYDSVEALRMLIMEQDFSYTVWNKIYKKEIFDGLRFVVGKLHEDVFFSPQAFGKSTKVVKNTLSLYFYRQRKDSIMGTSFSIRTLDSLEARKLQLEYIRQNYPKLESVAQERLLKSCMYFYQLALLTNDAKLKNYTLKETETIFNKEKPNLKFKGSKSEKLWLLLASLSFNGCCMIRNFLKVGL